EYGRIKSNSTVLDVGCGTGRFTLSISSAKSPMLYALDLSIEMLKQAAAKDEARGILWVRGDGQRLPFRDNLFDCIYMTLVIHHMEDKEAALRELYRTLKEGGSCVIMTNSHSRLKKHILRDFPGVIAIDLRRFPSVPSIRETMRKIGFRSVHHHIVQQDEGYVSTDEYLKRVRSKYISTLTLLSEEEFQKGFGIFQQRVWRKHGSRIRLITGFDFVVGQK
ncbi:MAG: methyltransferase domain-containing protein, partial [Thermoproteota archaeon]